MVGARRNPRAHAQDDEWCSGPGRRRAYCPTMCSIECRPSSSKRHITRDLSSCSSQRDIKLKEQWMRPCNKHSLRFTGVSNFSFFWRKDRKAGREQEGSYWILSSSWARRRDWPWALVASAPPTLEHLRSSARLGTRARRGDGLRRLGSDTWVSPGGCASAWEDDDLRSLQGPVW